MALIEAVVGITAGVLWGYVRGLDFVFTELYNIFDNIPTAIVLILISYVATPSIWTMVLGMAIKLDRNGTLHPQPDPHHPRPGL